jgi:NAD(P)-dependent dehydrogenase (short-subunit alcohol dehydrogenase family)
LGNGAVNIMIGGCMSGKKRHILITGASTGIGEACVIHLAKRGFSILAGVRKETDARAIEQAGGANVRGVLLDVTDGQTIAAAAKIASEITGGDGLFGLVNNAGMSINGPVEHVSLPDWRRQFDVNLFGQIAVTQAMLPLLRNAVTSHGRGAPRIVMMSSIAGRMTPPIIGPYSASKFALEAVSDALRQELRPQGIGVCIVEPGAIATPIWSKAERGEGATAPDHPSRQLYGRIIDAVVASARQSAAAAISTDAVAGVVEKCLTLRRPRARYLVGNDAKVAALGKRFLPAWAMDGLIRKAMKL